jgi:hypothetical protein
MRVALISGVMIFISAIAVALIQLWFAPWQAENFFKIEITLGALFVIAVALWFTRKEYKYYRRQQTDVRLDE